MGGVCIGPLSPLYPIIMLIQIQEFYFIRRIEDMFAISQEDAAMSCSQSPADSGNEPSE